MRTSRVQSALGLLLRPSLASTGARFCPAQARWAHKDSEPVIPPTLPFVPDVETFLTLIGRGLKQHAPKFPSWESLFTLSSDQLRELQIEPPRTRRYLLRWRKRYIEGKYGPGGDFKHVENGRAELKVLEQGIFVPVRKVINVPPGKIATEIPEKQRVRPKGYKVQGFKTIVGSYALPMKDGGAQVTVTEGMWEDRRGHKVDGGERRRAEVRFKRGVAQRKEAREKQGLY
jgi:hypothetical protein